MPLVTNINKLNKKVNNINFRFNQSSFNQVLKFRRSIPSYARRIHQFRIFDRPLRCTTASCLWQPHPKTFEQLELPGASRGGNFELDKTKRLLRLRSKKPPKKKGKKKRRERRYTQVASYRLAASSCLTRTRCPNFPATKEWLMHVCVDRTE